MTKIESKELTTDITQQLLKAASQARQTAYAPYSKFAVGAAVLTADGTVFSGCNIENASYGATVCAERVAVFKAVSAGHKSIKAVCVVADLPAPVSPCGICRQVIGEFGPGADVVMANTKDQVRTVTLKELLPYAFEYPA